MAYAATPAARPDEAAPAPLEEVKAPPTIDKHGGKLTPMTNCWGGLEFGSLLVGSFILASPFAALIYGFGLSHRPPSAFRTVIKSMAIGIPAIVTLFVGVMALLAGESLAAGRLFVLLGLGFALCAIGDAFLAGDPKRWLPPGLVAFLLGHICFIVLFAMARETQAIGPGVYVAIAAVVLSGGAMLAWLWPKLGNLRWPVVAYVVVIVAMVCLGLTHWSHNIAWAIGGLLFMASDAILAGQLFRGAKLPGPQRLTDWAIWFLYYGAQVAFLAGMIGYAAKI